jgi:GNAT superfamily N-acetyltransferase
VIEHVEIDGKGATVAYIDGGFKPVDKDAAVYAKVSFDDLIESPVFVALPSGSKHFDPAWLNKFDPNEPRDERGRWTEVGGDGGAGESGFAFVSPNVEHLGFESAKRSLQGDRQKALRMASGEIDRQLGQQATDKDIIGAWADGAENSVMTTVKNADWDTLRAAGAMKGYLADQKQVLLFRQQSGGPAALYTFEAPGTVDQIHKDLLEDGVAFHTIVPHEGSGATVHVADLDGSAHDAVAKAAERYDTTVEFQRGNAEFIGTVQESGTDRDQRDDARRAYREIIEKSPVQGVEATWRRVHNRWGETLNPDNDSFVTEHNGDANQALIETAHSGGSKLPVAEVRLNNEDAVTGFLTPEGQVLETYDSHDRAARDAGTSLDKVFKDGGARFFYFPHEYVALDMAERPSEQQMRVVQNAVRAGHVPTFYASAGMETGGPLDGTFKTAQERTTERDVLATINKVFPLLPSHVERGGYMVLFERQSDGSIAMYDPPQWRFDPDEPRDPHGRWTDGGGADGTTDKPKREHPGEGYSASAWVDKDGVIHTSNVYDAQRALFENRKVALKQLKQVSTLIMRLGETAKEMAEQGEEAPVFNLCNVSIEGTNLFCSQQKGIPRAEMPVIPAKQTKAFVKHLKSLGYEIERSTERADHLRATQSEISGAKVAASMERIRKEGFYKRLVVSDDDYILDGHHTWAGQLGVDAQDNTLKGDKHVKISRVNIDIIKLIEIADQWTKEHGIAKKPASEKPKHYRRMTIEQARRALDPATFRKYLATAQEFYRLNPQIERDDAKLMLTVRWDESQHPREPAGTSTGGQFAHGGGGDHHPVAAPPPAPATAAVTWADFGKAGINFDDSANSHREAFTKAWNENVKMSPDEYKHIALGGMQGRIRLGYSTNTHKMVTVGHLTNAAGDDIGKQQFTLNFVDKSASGDWLELKHSDQGHGIAKKLLSSQIEMAQKLGLDRIELTAGLSTGGYAWAKFGMVPDRTSWRSLSATIRQRLTQQSEREERYRGTGEYDTPGSWDEMSTSDQDDIFEAWKEDTREEFENSERDSYYENGQALDDTKYSMAHNFDPDDSWAQEALSEWVDTWDADHPEHAVPFTAEQIGKALSFEYEGDGEGRNDPDMDIDNEKLKEPKGYDPNQPSLPGIEAQQPHERLTQDMRDDLETAMVEAFNKQADRDYGDADVPDWVMENVSEYQDEYWSSMGDRDKYAWAERNDRLPRIEIETAEDEEPDEAPVEVPEDKTREALKKLAQSTDPKAIWAIADSPYGKELLLGTGWSGELNFKDKQAMTRLYAYISAAKAAGAAAAAAVAEAAKKPVAQAA